MANRAARFAGAALTAFAGTAHALDPALEPYKAEAPISGAIEVAGNHATDDLMLAWAKGFARFHPDARLHLRSDTRLTTDAFDVAIGERAVDLVPSARELVPSEIARLQGKLGGAPLVIAVATGSYATKSGTHAIAFYVNAENPLARISVAQLREIYAPGGRVTKWGDLGLTGEWKDQPIRVFSVPISDPNGNPLGIVNYLAMRMLGGKPGWRRSLYQVDSNGPLLGQHMLNRIVREVARNRYAIGYSGFAFAASGAKALAVAENDAGPWFVGTHDEVAARTYPFTRTIYISVNQREGAALRPEIREFLRFVLSREGQAVLTQGPEKYLPLTAELAKHELSRIY